MLRQRAEEIVRAAVEKRYGREAPDLVRVEVTKDRALGDFATNIAMILAGKVKEPPRKIAEAIVPDLKSAPLFDEVEIAGPGFINFRLPPEAFRELLAHILHEGTSFGRAKTVGPERHQIEFVSANPTGPLNVVSARAAAVGDTLARLLEATGIITEREFYVNDHGTQVDHLLRSVLWYREGKKGEFPEQGYRGTYVADLAARSEAELDPLFSVEEGGVGREEIGPVQRAMGEVARGETGKLLEAIGRLGQKKPPLAVTRPASEALLRTWVVEQILREQREDLADFGVRFDLWFRESTLHGEGMVEKTFAVLSESGDVYEKEGARWFRSTAYGDDEDRVLVRSSGEPTYFLADIAYHRNKGERGFDHVIDILGPDHHGHVPRMLAAVEALGKGRLWLEVFIVQQVNLLRQGKTVQMSKRAGEFVTLRDLLDEVGPDASRFFFLLLRPNSHLNFDLDLAKSRTMDNPVYYVQYAHARICSVFEHAAAAGIDWERSSEPPLDRLGEEDELELLRALDAFPDVVRAAAATREPHRVPVYLKELAALFHGFYHRVKVVTGNEEETLARLALLQGVRAVLRSGLDLLGVTAPEKM